MDGGETFRVSDFGFSAYLLVNGFLLVDIVADEQSPRRKIFVLSGSPLRFAALAERFRIGDASVDARAFLDAQRRLKHVLYGFGA
jgi:hypothetical protein